MGLLDQLRADDGYSRNHEEWQNLPSLLTDVLPEYQHKKTVLIRGEVIVIGSVPTIGLPRYFYAVMHSERTAGTLEGSKNFPHWELLGARPGRARPVAMGVSRYRAEAETNYYTDPWVAWVEHGAEPLTDWIAGILTTTTQDTPQMELRRGRRT